MNLDEFAKCKGYTDLTAMSEDQRIDVAGQYVIENDVIAAVLVDNERDKIERYCRKIINRHQGRVRVLSRTPGPTHGVYTIKIQKTPEHLIPRNWT